MENASKALIIAGAILISIILISIGIMVIQAGQGVVGDAEKQMDQQAIQVFNANFVNNVGRQRGTTVRTLLQSAQASNAAHTEADDGLLINVTVPSGDKGTDQNEIGKAIAEIRTTKTYNVELSYSTVGRVNAITISETTTGGSGT